MHAALAFHGIIPEYVAETTCVTTGRPATIDSPFGRIRYRHIKKDVFFGYSRVGSGLQQAVVATVEKALLDLFYLTPGSDDPEYIRGLRLQDLDTLDSAALSRMARRFASPKIERAASLVSRLVEEGDEI
jgi:predicted transcriptional regulator of viral defense system